MERRELRIEVGAQVGFPNPAQIAASVFIPDEGPIHTPPIVAFASPGGGYSRGYFDLPAFNGEAYSQAEHHAAAGIIFVAYDHIGVGESTIPDDVTLTNDILAAANDAAIRAMLRMFEEGTMSKSLPPLKHVFKIGIGQSLGGCITILMQGNHRTFDAIAPLGASALQGVLPQRTEEERLKGIEGFRVHQIDPDNLPETATLAREVTDFVYPFFYDDIPSEIIEADQKGGFPVRDTAPPWGSKTIPRCASLFMTKGHLTQAAASIEVPVFIGLGERDTYFDPLAEPGYFGKSRDISLFIVPRMAHMHNFANTRGFLYNRIAAWAKMVSRETPE
jgi:pimeloyl-ACP methyl ester carboxylesterase